MRRAVPEINASSMADIAFLLLFYFLIATTMDIDTGIQQKLPPIDKTKQLEAPPVEERNVLKVQIVSENKILLDGKQVAPIDLAARIKIFIKNPNNLRHLSAKYLEFISPIGSTPVSKGIILIQFDSLADYKTYVVVHDVINSAFLDMRKEFAKQKFHYSLAKITQPNRLEAIRKAIPMQIVEEQLNAKR